MHSDPNDPYLAAFCCVLASVLISAAPVWAALLARVPRGADGERRPWVRVLGVLVLWQAFNLSMLATWGAFVARGDEGVMPDLLIALLIMQPAALVFVLRAGSARDSAAPDRNERGR